MNFLNINYSSKLWNEPSDVMCYTMQTVRSTLQSVHHTPVRFECPGFESRDIFKVFIQSRKTFTLSGIDTRLNC